MSTFNVCFHSSLNSRVKVSVDGALLISKLIPEDSGNYTCIPSNGLFTPPLASAYLKVNYPARVVHMPRETYLPSGMGGTIVCPFQAEPPVLFVNWTKDGAFLDLRQYPGWIINSEGSLFIATANDNALGVYTCTAYNSYGTMGPSAPTKVFLKNPPLFQMFPEAQYLQEVGRKLIIPCQAHGDPAPNITWIKVNSTPYSPFTVLSNGSLVLNPLTKNHHGVWECHAINSVGKASKSTMVLVFGTSPHAVTAVFIDPGINNATIFWKPGFDGGYTQKFSIWVKPTYKRKHEWRSISVPTSESSLLVTGLQPASSYQFSILPQNKLGSGPFCEIFTIMTLALLTDPPTEITDIAAPLAPTVLSVYYTSVGVLLKWLPPPAQSQLITAFILQARQGQGKWVILNKEINVNATEILVQGLTRDSCYELRLLSQGVEMVSHPSELVNINTKGMEVYPAPPRWLTFATRPLMAGVIAGVCFLFVAIILSVVTACVMNHRRTQCSKKARDVISLALQRTRSPQASFTGTSLNSTLKNKFCTITIFSDSSFSDSSDHSSIDKSYQNEYQEQKKHLLPSSSPPPCYTLFESHFGSSPSSLSAIESISRGPDVRFITQPCLEDSMATQIKAKKGCLLSSGHDNGGGSKSSSFQESSKSSSNESKEVIQDPPFTRQKSQSKCLTLIKEQVEPKSFINSHGAQTCDKEQRQNKSVSPVRRWAGVEMEKPILKVQNIPLRQKAQRPNSQQRLSEHRRGYYFGITSSPMDRLLTSTAQNMQWDISPVTPSTNQVPVLSLSEGNTPHLTLPDTPHTDLKVEDLAADKFSNSLVTQYTSLSILSQQRDSVSCYESAKSQASCSVGPLVKELLPEDHRIKEKELKMHPNVPMSTCHVPNSFHSERTQHSTVKREKGNLSHDFTDCFNVANDSRHDNCKNKTEDSPSSSSSQPEIEKECIRAHSRKNDECVFSVSSNHISPRSLPKSEVESEQSNSSVKLCGLSEAKHLPKPDRMSPLQQSTILEYLSLPGFVEMSVDEPIEESESSWICPKQVNRILLKTEPDVDSKNCENKVSCHLKESNDHKSRILVYHKIPIVPVRSSIHENITSSKPCLALTQESTNIKSRSLKTKCGSSEYLGRSPNSFIFNKGFRSDNTTRLNSAKSLVHTIYNLPYQGEGVEESLSKHSWWCQPQNRRNNQVNAQIPQAIKNSVSIGPCKSFPGMGQPRPYLKKKLGSQKWKHYQSSSAYVSDNCYNGELPLNVKDAFYNLGFAPTNTSLRSRQGAECGKSYRSYAIPCSKERLYMTPLTVVHGHGPSVLSKSPTVKPVNLYKQEADPRRCPLSYQESLRLAQHKYVPHCPSRPISVPRQVARWEQPCFVNSIKSFQRPFLPMCYSWPSPYQAAMPLGQMRRESVEKSKERDNKGDGNQASYATQSSGRGSVGPFGYHRQSFSIIPTLSSSPESEEGKRHKRVLDLQKQTSERNASVDECLNEFESTECRVGLDCTEILKIKQVGMRTGRNKPFLSTGLQVQGPTLVSFPSASEPPQQNSHSLSEAHFNALMQEFQAYRRAQNSPHPLSDLHN